MASADAIASFKVVPIFAYPCNFAHRTTNAAFREQNAKALPTGEGPAFLGYSLVNSGAGRLVNVNAVDINH